MYVVILKNSNGTSNFSTGLPNVVIFSNANHFVKKLLDNHSRRFHFLEVIVGLWRVPNLKLITLKKLLKVTPVIFP